MSVFIPCVTPWERWEVSEKMEKGRDCQPEWFLLLSSTKSLLEHLCLAWSWISERIPKWKYHSGIGIQEYYKILVFSRFNIPNSWSPEKYFFGHPLIFTIKVGQIPKALKTLLHHFLLIIQKWHHSISKAPPVVGSASLPSKKQGPKALKGAVCLVLEPAQKLVPSGPRWPNKTDFPG